MPIIDWSSDVCSSDLGAGRHRTSNNEPRPAPRSSADAIAGDDAAIAAGDPAARAVEPRDRGVHRRGDREEPAARIGRSEEHTSELQSLMRISYAVFCLKQKKTQTPIDN